jgi:hypothetical protein
MQSPPRAWADADHALKRAREMTLVRKPAVERDIG